ncbi:MAG: response regulator [bacterium]|nr:response regulator [bacterium]
MDLMDQEILKEFIIEANELLGNAEEDVLDIEDRSDKETVNRIFRAFHTVKGNAAMLGIDDVATLAHHAEDQLSKVRSGKTEPNKKMIDLLLKVIDSLKQLLEDARDSVPSMVNVEGLITKLDNIGQPEPALTGEPATKLVIPKNHTIRKPPEAGSLKLLVTEDDFTSRKLIKIMLSKYGEVDIAVNGTEAVEAVKLAFSTTPPNPYHMICMDIMMPELDGMEAVKQIRAIEKKNEVPLRGEQVIVMTTALNDPKTVIKALYKCGASSYLVKPIERDQLEKELKKHGLIKS